MGLCIASMIASMAHRGNPRGYVPDIHPLPSYFLSTFFPFFLLLLHFLSGIFHFVRGFCPAEGLRYADSAYAAGHCVFKWQIKCFATTSRLIGRAGRVPMPEWCCSGDERFISLSDGEISKGFLTYESRVKILKTNLLISDRRLILYNKLLNHNRETLYCGLIIYYIK